ncbi:MAG: hypothetical protein ACLT9J_10855, partial [Agathobacter rectalis]
SYVLLRLKGIHSHGKYQHLIVLNKMELDVVNLIKQVSIEHVDKMKERDSELKWKCAGRKSTVNA